MVAARSSLNHGRVKEPNLSNVSTESSHSGFDVAKLAKSVGISSFSSDAESLGDFRYEH